MIGKLSHSRHGLEELPFAECKGKGHEYGRNPTGSDRFEIGAYSGRSPKCNCVQNAVLRRPGNARMIRQEIFRESIFCLSLFSARSLNLKRRSGDFPFSNSCHVGAACDCLRRRLGPPSQINNPGLFQPRLVSEPRSSLPLNDNDCPAQRVLVILRV